MMEESMRHLLRQATHQVNDEAYKLLETMPLGRIRVSQVFRRNEVAGLKHHHLGEVTARERDHRVLRAGLTYLPSLHMLFFVR